MFKNPLFSRACAYKGSIPETYTRNAKIAFRVYNSSDFQAKTTTCEGVLYLKRKPEYLSENWPGIRKAISQITYFHILSHQRGPR